MKKTRKEYRIRKMIRLFRVIFLNLCIQTRFQYGNTVSGSSVVQVSNYFPFLM